MKRYLLTGLGILIFFIIMTLATLVYYTNNKTQPNNDLTPTPIPTIYPNTNSDYIKSFNDLSKQLPTQTAPYEKVSELIKVLPHTGKSFTLKYDITLNQFDLILDKNNPELGQQEFQQFLSSSQVDPSLLDIVTSYK